MKRAKSEFNGEKTEKSTKKRKQDTTQEYLDDIEKIEEMRKVKNAPVDLMGVHCAPDKKASEKDQRYQLLVSLMLSSQTKDGINHETTEKMHENLESFDVHTISELSPEEIDKHIKKVGFHNKKSVYLKKASEILLEKYDGDTPRDIEDLMALPGVGPKMSHIFMYHAYGVVTGIGVDVHVHRISNRLGWVETKTPEQTRKKLQEILPKELWGSINVLLVGFGQTICTPVSPKCGRCLLRATCPSSSAR